MATTHPSGVHSPAEAAPRLRVGARAFAGYCLERDTIVRSVQTALVVGTILGLINHGQDLLARQFSARWMVPLLITYLVPFSVATFGQAQGKRQRDRRAEPYADPARHPGASSDRQEARMRSLFRRSGKAAKAPPLAPTGERTDEQPDDVTPTDGGRAAESRPVGFAPVAELIGFRPVSIQPGEAIMEMQTDGRHANPMGTLHGGILCDIADAAMGMAYASTLEPGESFTTLELKINYLRPVWQARLRAVGRVVQRGRTVGLVECDVFDEQQRLIARASSTCLTLRGERARGREVSIGSSEK